MSDNTVNLTKENFEKTISNGVTLVDFWAPWCGPCKMQAPHLEEAAGTLAGRAQVGKLNVDENPSLAQKFGVSGIPSLLVFKNGKEVKRFVGLSDAATLVQTVENQL